MPSKRLEISEVRERLAGKNGRTYWRALEELADTEEFTDFLHREFPRFASEWDESFSRRSFLKVMSASLALAGLAGCSRQPEEHIVPYVRTPENVVPGEPLFFATAAPFAGYGTGLLVESHTGRPTKIEGNPAHPASLGATDAFTQASILNLYDPDRIQTITREGEPIGWDSFVSLFGMEVESRQGANGAGLHILTGTVTSPTLADQMERIRARMPEAKWHQFDGVDRDNIRMGARAAFGEDVSIQHRFDRADVVLSLDSDFLVHGPGSIRYARDFAGKRRQPVDQDNQMNRLYAVECAPRLTGAMADHRLAVKPSMAEDMARAIAAELGVEADSGGVDRAKEAHGPWIEAVARDLEAHRGSSIVIAGDEQPAFVHALAHAMNMALGNVGETVIYTAPAEANPVNQRESLQELADALDAGDVETLIILGGNPVYTAPADLNLAERLGQASSTVYVSLFADETAEHCTWVVPDQHYLESWSDVRAYDGTASIIQPLIKPLYDCHSAHETLAILTGEGGKSGYDIVRDYWREQNLGGGDFERAWKKALSDGFIEGSGLSSKPVALRSGLDPGGSASNGGLEIAFRPDPTIWDGSFANNGWMQELPKPLTKLTWDNAVLISPRTAEERGLATEDVVALTVDGRSVNAPVWVMPGHPDGCVTVHLGYGRTHAGRVGDGAGFNANLVRTSQAPWRADDVSIEPTGDRYRLATTQMHHSMEGRSLVRAAGAEEYLAHPEIFTEMRSEPRHDQTMYSPDEHAYDGYAWGMTIDLSQCTGCSACVIACQAENNIPVVGKEQVIAGREMHWIRIDRYYEGDIDNPEAYHQPIPCMHCEKAPCEVVCPVNATVHSHEGLNEQIYNRCIGTRFCSNNCPYKVRRFNFLRYTQKEDSEQRRMQRNPNVTVRGVGVMEKCTYCVQRINKARINAKREDRSIQDGEVVVACQAACPAGAIQFGDISDPDSRVSKAKSEPRDYALLGDLNVRPRTTYLAKLKNPNPELETESTHGV